jgi:hypothetical protein
MPPSGGGAPQSVDDLGAQQVQPQYEETVHSSAAQFDPDGGYAPGSHVGSQS